MLQYLASMPNKTNHNNDFYTVHQECDTRLGQERVYDAIIGLFLPSCLILRSRSDFSPHFPVALSYCWNRDFAALCLLCSGLSFAPAIHWQISGWNKLSTGDSGSQTAYLATDCETADKRVSKPAKCSGNWKAERVSKYHLRGREGGREREAEAVRKGINKERKDEWEAEIKTRQEGRAVSGKG